MTEHVAARQPLAHLFTVPLDVVRRRVTNPKATAPAPKTPRSARRSVPSAMIPKETRP